jgi:hypothetical protein
MKICRVTGKEAKVHVTIQNTYYSEDYEMPQRLEDYMFNPQHGQTILNVVRDKSDDCADWKTTNISCSECNSSMSLSAVQSHFLSEGVYKKYVTQMGKRQEMD